MYRECIYRILCINSCKSGGGVVKYRIAKMGRQGHGFCREDKGRRRI